MVIYPVDSTAQSLDWARRIERFQKIVKKVIIITSSAVMLNSTGFRFESMNRYNR